MVNMYFCLSDVSLMRHKFTLDGCLVWDLKKTNNNTLTPENPKANITAIHYTRISSSCGPALHKSLLISALANLDDRVKHTHIEKEIKRDQGRFCCLEEECDRHYLSSYQYLFPNACRLSPAQIATRRAVPSEIYSTSFRVTGQRVGRILRKMKCVCAFLLHLISVLFLW